MDRQGGAPHLQRDRVDAVAFNFCVHPAFNSAKSGKKIDLLKFDLVHNCHLDLRDFDEIYSATAKSNLNRFQIFLVACIRFLLGLHGEMKG